MKIYHKFLLYQNKLLKPYVRILLGLVEALTYLASLLLIVGVVYEHGFPLSPVEVQQIQILYKAVWIIFLIDVTLHISLEYRNTKKQYRRLAWILSVLLYLTLVPVIFHRPEEEGAILQVWEFLHGKFYHLILLLVFSLLNLSNGLVRLLGRRTNPSGCQLYGYYSDRDGIADASTMYGQWHHLGRFSVYSHQCRLCDGLGAGRRIHHFHHQRTCSHYPAHSDRRTGSDDINQFLCHVLYGKYFHLQSARCP